MQSLRTTRRPTLLLACSAATLLTACAARPPQARGYYIDHEIGPRITVTQLNQPVTAEVGAPIWRSGETQVEIVTTVRLNVDARSTMDAGHRLNVRAGTVGTLMRRKDNGQLAVCYVATGPGAAVVSITGGGNVSSCLVDKKRSGVFEVAMFERYEKDFPLEAPVPYTVVSKTDRTVEVPSFTRKQLLYQGAGGGVLRLSYREFTNNDLARPSFTQDLSYDLHPSEPTEVGFKGLRMKVLSATNKGMTAIIEQPAQD